jgi:hypothetical protein
MSNMQRAALIEFVALVVLLVLCFVGAGWLSR